IQAIGPAAAPGVLDDGIVRQRCAHGGDPCFIVVLGGGRPVQCCSELFIVNPPIVQLFSLTCSFLFRGESLFCLTR
ncbi:MAG: hypothetical protein ACRESF_23230, partial [Pseudomonas sp.]